MKVEDSKSYLLGAGTDGGTSDSKNNFCNIPNGHAYSLISVFPLLNSTGGIDYRLYMVRNPWASTVYNLSWSSSDTTNWK